ncbi:hypothetical protein GCM10020255_090070 [Rhodococcus baikonurensis]
MALPRRRSASWCRDVRALVRSVVPANEQSPSRWCRTRRCRTPSNWRFEAENPGIDLKFVSLSENQARAKITASTATGGGEFDVVMISNYETPQWAANGWLTNLSEYADKTPGYDEDDFIPSIKTSLSYEDSMYAVLFYGESSFLMYRKDLFDQAGITVPEDPTWQEVAGWAAQFDNPDAKMAGICLRGKPGWGEVLAPLNTVINTFGGRWYDENWNAQLTSPQVEDAVQFYVDTVKEHGQPGPATSGFGECATQFAQGNTAMWYDATSAVSVLEDPASSKVVGNIGYAKAPKVEKSDPGWLYTWALGIPESAQNKDDAWKFISWMTNKDYIQKVGTELGWSRVPPGSRLSTYEIPEYQEAAQAFGPITLESINNANPKTRQCNRFRTPASSSSPSLSFRTWAPASASRSVLPSRVRRA